MFWGPARKQIDRQPTLPAKHAPPPRTLLGRNRGGRHQACVLDIRGVANAWAAQLPARSGGLPSATLFAAKRLLLAPPSAWVVDE